MRFNPTDLELYANSFSLAEDAVLVELNRETHAKVLKPQMLSGPLQGNLLRLFVQMMKAKNILEIGTFTGYSAICMAQAMPKGGHLHTIDINDELQDMALQYFTKAGLQNTITLHVGNALEVIPSLDQTFDFVFIDADKSNYSRYYDLVFSKVIKGGLILADNVLWSGKVVQENHDKKTAAIHAFNKKVQEDSRVENLLLPIRDGIMMARKL